MCGVQHVGLKKKLLDRGLQLKLHMLSELTDHQRRLLEAFKPGSTTPQEERERLAIADLVFKYLDVMLKIPPLNTMEAV